MEQENKNKSVNKDQDQNTSANQPDKDKYNRTKEQVIAAHEQADKDIEQDADLSIHSPNDDLDEGETARLGEDETDII